MAAFAGLDVGTTSSKAVVYGEDGAALGIGRVATVGMSARRALRPTRRPCGAAR